MAVEVGDESKSAQDARTSALFAGLLCVVHLCAGWEQESETDREVYDHLEPVALTTRLGARARASAVVFFLRVSA